MKKIKLAVGAIFVILAVVLAYQSSLVSAMLSFANSAGTGSSTGLYFAILIAISGISYILFAESNNKILKLIPLGLNLVATFVAMLFASKSFHDLKLWGIVTAIVSLVIVMWDLRTNQSVEDEDTYIKEIEETPETIETSRRGKHRANNWITNDKSWWLILIANLCFLTVAMFIGFATINNSLHGAMVEKTTENAVREDSDEGSPKSTNVSDPNNVGHAPLRKAGQYFYSDHYGKISLLGLSTDKKHSQGTGQVGTTVDLVKIATNKPLNSDQQFNSGNDFDTNKLTSPYTYLKSQYTVANNSNRSIIVGGLKQIVLPDGKQINSSDKSVIDSGQGEELAPHAKRSYYLHILLDKKSDAYRPKFVHLYFEEISDSDSFVIQGSQFDVIMPISYKM